MEYIINHIPKNTPKNRRPGTKMVPNTITVHNTANPTSTALNERNWLTNPNNFVTASWHIAIDDKQAVEAIPLHEIAWHAGDGSNGPGNRTSIAIEICESGDQKRVWNNAVKLIAKMLHERGWNISQVRTHKSWSGKNCPRLILPEWSRFISDIEKELSQLNWDTEVLDRMSDWAVESYKWVIDTKISDGERPKDSVTREEMWTMLHRFYNKFIK